VRWWRRRVHRSSYCVPKASEECMKRWNAGRARSLGYSPVCPSIPALGISKSYIRREIVTTAIPRPSAWVATKPVGRWLSTNHLKWAGKAAKQIAAKRSTSQNNVCKRNRGQNGTRLYFRADTRSRTSRLWCCRGLLAGKSLARSVYKAKLGVLGV